MQERLQTLRNPAQVGHVHSGIAYGKRFDVDKRPLAVIILKNEICDLYSLLVEIYLCDGDSEIERWTTGFSAALRYSSKRHVLVVEYFVLSARGSDLPPDFRTMD